MNPLEFWRQWNEMIIGGDPLGVMAGWVKVMENVQEKAHSGESLSVDPFTLFYEWYNAMSKPWSRMVEDVIGSERFLEFSSSFLENHSRLVSTFRQVSEAYCKLLRLPTLSDIARVADLVVGLEEKVDNIEDAIERVEERTTSGAATMVSMMDLEQRLNQIETRLDRMLALLEQGEAEPTSTKIKSKRSIKEKDHQDDQ
jgi:polyhydroxyalkanoic acid synthase PhaR subunit